MKTILIIDGNSILNRAFYGIRPLSNKDGLPTNAVYGFITILKKHLDALMPDRIVCAFDQKAPTFRHNMFSGYKATRKGMPEELAMQLPYAKRIAAALGAHVISLAGYEADDILGTVSARAEAQGGWHAYVLTGDRDSLQLISPATTVILAKTKEDVHYTPELFREEYGITPEQFVDVKALMGDSSDNIPGVPGIGEKTALKLISSMGSLDAIYAEDAAPDVTKSVKEKLAAGRDSAYLSRDLAKICRQAPLDEDVPEPVMDAAQLSALFDELEFTALKARFALDEETAAPQESLDIPEFRPFDADLLPGEGTLFVAADADGNLALICGDVRMAGSLGEIAPHIAGRSVCCHDYKQLYGQLLRLGVQVQCVFDTMLAAYLLMPGESAYPLAKTAQRFLAADIPAVESVQMQAYLLTFLMPVLEEKLAGLGMSSLLTDMEIPLAEVLFEMEDAGFLLDADGLHQYITGLQQTARDIAERIYMLAGAEFNINSPKQMGEILFERLGLPAGKKTRTGYATDAETLDKLRPYHPIIGEILEYRQLIKLCGTYGDNLIALAGEDGKIHSRFNQTGTATGRLSSADPNMQNIPVRGQLGRELRKFFTATDKDHILLDADYSQIELRLLAEISGDKNMRHAFLAGTDIHRSTASQVFHVPVEEVSQELRLRAKAVNFGIVYGIGEYSLSQDLKISRKQAKEYITSYLATYPGVDAYLKNSVENAKRDQYTTTMFGRKRFIPELASKNQNIRAFGERVAMNSPIQGTAADIIKIAMIRAHRGLKEAGIDAKLILQVHDELIVEASLADADRAAEILREAMESAAQTTVPLTAEVSAGWTWYDAKQ
ncbi:MAG: DNA polymerase I [Ruminococcaceae bacterium]|nr:DNA polymerase I [Oscillospiraceae bacterium]